MNENIKAGADIHAGDGGYSEGTKEGYEAFVKARNSSKGKPTLYLVRGCPGAGALHLHGHCHGNHKDNKGKMLNVGLDSAYNIFGEHRFFTEDEIVQLLKDKETYISDHHKERL